MEKVLIITYYWPPSGGASVQRWLKLSKYLLRFDIEPIVLTVDEESIDSITTFVAGLIMSVLISLTG